MHITEAVTAASVALAGVALGITAALRAGREHHTTPTPAQRPHADAYRPCHTTTCGHMTTGHDRTEAGLVCRDCGTTTEVEQ